jgi:ABC-type phosphate transport system substrate-binding protein
MKVQEKSFAFMKIKIRKAKKEDIETIVELNKQLADYHRKIDGYYRPGSETRKSFKNYLSGIIQFKEFMKKMRLDL